MPAPCLPLARYRAQFSSTSTIHFNDFPGNAWRGALGHALKRTVCVTHQAECRECLLYRSCIYPYFWDTPPHLGAAKMSKYQTAPHPFVLYIDTNAPLVLEFTLFGHANRHLPVFIHALAQAANNPRGIANNTLVLTHIEQCVTPDADHWQLVHIAEQVLTPLPAASPTYPPAPRSCVIECITPLRIKRDGRHVGARDFTFADLFSNLLRRISMLSYFHTDSPLDVDFKALNEAAREISASGELAWQEHSRYSKRQHTAMRMGGVIGRITLSDSDLSFFWPYLWLGQYTHAGSGATMGLGRYRIAASLQTGGDSKK